MKRDDEKFLFKDSFCLFFFFFFFFETYKDRDRRVNQERNQPKRGRERDRAKLINLPHA